ncbi:MAG: type II toxin-antitoxin system HipA family toxin [Solirubrobacteraceae bacterium]|jgi:serine/threonine-protein kinase HipA
MSVRTLDVWCADEHAGVLTDGAQGLELAYTDAWHAGGHPPLSQSLSLDGSYDRVAVEAFFGGLLPEGAPREQLARNLGVSAGNDFELLAALGGDTAGAISLLAPGTVPEPIGEDVEWLADRDLVELLDELPSRPMHADQDGEYRLSLAGAQDKLPVVVGDDGRIGLTRGRTPSTHILKTPIVHLDGTVANEALCPAIGRLLGIETVTAVPRRVADHELLLIERYDRRHTDTGVRRLHQEDFCQALGVPVWRKYQAEGGPGLSDCFSLLRRAVAVPARDAVNLLDTVMLSFLVGNNDAHAKNYSLLYLPDMSRPVLSPAYDILSTVAYRKTRPMSRKMAMSIGGEYRPEYVRSRHLDRLIDGAGLGAAAVRRRLRGFAAEAPAAARQARKDLAADGWDAPVLARVIETVEQRAAWLMEIAASSSSSSSSSSPPQVRGN